MKSLCDQSGGAGHVLHQIAQVASVDVFGSILVLAKEHPEGKEEFSPQRELGERRCA